MIEEQSIQREEGIHGARWRTFHDGFSNPEMALPFLDSIENVIGVSHPAVIAGLGGGTGFIMGELLMRLYLPEVRLANVDIFPKQLCICNDKRISFSKNLHLSLNADRFKSKMSSCY